LDASGRELLSRKIENDEAEILKLIDEALSLAKGIVWAAWRSCWHFCGSETRGSSTFPASPWIEPAMLLPGRV
jgi:hypothetical protein